MAPRSIWNGTITFGTIKVPVQLFSALQDKSVHLHLLDKRSKRPVHEKMVNPSTGAPVASNEIRKAFDTGKGALVVLEPAEQEAVQPKESRDIRVEHFFAPQQITHQWYERAYWLGPDSKSKAAYFALAKALKTQEKEGLARWVMRKKEYVGALKPDGDYLMLIELRHAYEVIPVSELAAPEGQPLADREVEAAKQLVHVMEGHFDITEYHDEYRERVMELVEAKEKGKVLRFPKAPRKTTGRSLTAMLERSLEAARKQKKERASA